MLMKLPLTRAIVSAPRLGFLDTMVCMSNYLVARGIPYRKCGGAFWGQSLERGMTDLVREGVEWILTLDYDCLFDEAAVGRIFQLMLEHPEADAIAPLMSKRGTDTALLRICNEDGSPKGVLTDDDLGEDLVRADAAHFGLTCLRVSALKKMRHPWFHGQPNEVGEWGDGRTDDDIYFWRKWKEAGNSLFIAHRVPVGHLELMAAWPSQDFRPAWDYPSDFEKRGRPSWARR